jgi:ActR/RegA family two-component response regulator
MSNQILFVDDDVSLLNTMKRNLSMEFKVYTAEGGDAAAEVVQQHGDFSVVVCDMQMPKQNGIQTIAMLREKMPNAVFIMLTGNQDLTTAIQAVNDGRVFRFLNKPCQVAEISDAIQAAQQQHNLVIAEKELLSGTLTGAINLLTDVIEMQQERHVDTARMAEALVDLATRMGLQTGWEEKVAARVFLVGIVMLDPEDSLKFASLDPTSAEHKALFARICKKSSSMLTRLPRLGFIVDLLKHVPKAERFEFGSGRIETGALLLRIVFYWNFLTNKGLCVEAATSVIQNIMPELSSRVIQCMQCLHDNHDAHMLTKLAIGKLRAGMIPYEDILLPAGGLALAKRRVLTEAMIENLLRMPGLEQTKVSVIANSIPRSV